jgi:hypothetical protein
VLRENALRVSQRTSPHNTKVQAPPNNTSSGRRIRGLRWHDRTSQSCSFDVEISSRKAELALASVSIRYPSPKSTCGVALGHRMPSVLETSSGMRATRSCCILDYHDFARQEMDGDMAWRAYMTADRPMNAFPFPLQESSSVPYPLFFPSKGGSATWSTSRLCCAICCAAVYCLQLLLTLLTNKQLAPPTHHPAPQGISPSPYFLLNTVHTKSDNVT